MSLKDHSSFANQGSVKVKHAHYDLDVDFSTKTISGIAKLKLVALEDGVSEVILDTRDLNINSATSGGQKLSFHFDKPHKALGSKLTISLTEPASKAKDVDLEVTFSTSPQSTALQWLEPSQTEGKQEPYLFSQCQAIHARSMVPCQDTPSVKSTYTATVRVPKGLQALMSATLAEGGGTESGEGRQTFSFRQDVPIPSYLLALAVGQLESRDLGPRSKVWSEPSTVDAAAWEFAETAAFLDAGEDIAGEYVFSRYDLLLMPSSYPYGGMENPQLSFITPTLLAGDRSLSNVIAHEISHSWSGNLITNASWEHFWLNEGMTVFLERAILGRLYGLPTLQQHAANGFLSLQDAVHSLGEDHPFTRLVPDLSSGEDPDDAFSKIPYEKGFYFLYYLQGLVGVKGFEGFLKAYVQEFKYKSIESNDFKAFFLSYFSNSPAVSEIDWDTWLYAPGMPPVENVYDTSLADEAYALAKAWHTSDVMGIGAAPPKAASPDNISGWSSEQVVAFLEKLAQLRSMQPLHSSTTRKIAALYALDTSKNAEIRAAWYRLCINAGDASILPLASAFLKEQGRMKYLRPLYRALFRSKIGKEIALQTFEVARPTYHPIAAKMVAVDLGQS